MNLTGKDIERELVQGLGTMAVEFQWGNVPDGQSQTDRDSFGVSALRSTEIVKDQEDPAWKVEFGNAVDSLSVNTGLIND